MAKVIEHHPQPTLCWGCKNANRFKCSWFNPANPQPVPGWTAVLRKVHGVKGDSYLVKECPNFAPEPPRDGRPNTTPSSGVAGVVWYAEAGQWEARICANGKKYYLGRYVSLQEAIAARRAAERALARGREPESERTTQTGVCHLKSSWTAHIRHQGKRYYLGSFNTQEEAMAARMAAEEAIARGGEPTLKRRKRHG